MKSLKVTVTDAVRIPLLHQDGPILVPMELSNATVLGLLRKGYHVFAHNGSEKVAVTTANLENPFAKAEKTIAPKEAPRRTLGEEVKETPQVSTPEVEPEAVAVEEVVEETPVVNKQESNHNKKNKNK